MNAKNGEFVLYGLQDYISVIDEIIEELNLCEFQFDIRLILTEGLTNAFKHGNKESNLLPIYLQYTFYEDEIIFEIVDSGSESNYVIIPNDIIEDDILVGSGRGLFLINCYSDEVHMEGNKLTIKKYL